MHISNISEAKAHLSSLIRRVRETGEPVIIGKAGEPVAVLLPYRKEDVPRRLGGSWEGKVSVRDDFDDPAGTISNSFYDSVLFPEQS